MGVLSPNSPDVLAPEATVAARGPGARSAPPHRLIVPMTLAKQIAKIGPTMNVFEKRNVLLGVEFDRYVKEHPEFRKKIPGNAHVILLLEGDDEFNQWSTRVGKAQAESSQPLLYVMIKRLGPARSRIEDLSWARG